MKSSALRLFSMVLILTIGQNVFSASKSDGFAVKSQAIRINLSSDGKIETMRLPMKKTIGP
jgi:hypothetical protein